MKTSRREFSIVMVIDKGIFKNTQITLWPVSSSYPKRGSVFTEFAHFFITYAVLPELAILSNLNAVNSLTSEVFHRSLLD